MRPLLPPGTVVYTNKLRGASLQELLAAANGNSWPNNECTEERALLRNWAIQAESLMVDQAEDLAWEERMRDLAGRDLPYAEWVLERQRALDERVRARKRAQTRLRYAYGFKQPRRWGLVAKSVRVLHARRSTDVEHL